MSDPENGPTRSTASVIEADAEGIKKSTAKGPSIRDALINTVSASERLAGIIPPAQIANAIAAQRFSSRALIDPILDQARFSVDHSMSRSLGSATLGLKEEIASISKSRTSLHIAEAMNQAHVLGTRDLIGPALAQLQFTVDRSISQSLKEMTEKMSIGASSIAGAMKPTDSATQEEPWRATEISKAFIPPFEQLQQSVKAMYPAYVGLIEATRHIGEDVALVDPLSEIRQRLISIPEFDLSQLTRSIPHFLASLEEFTLKEEAAAFSLLAKRGLTGMEQYLSPGEARHILKLKKSKGSKAVDAYIFRQFRSNKFKALNAMVRDWWRVPYLKKRKAIVLGALRAHKRGEYELAIPTLLPLADGLSAEIVKGSPGLVKKTIYAKEAAALYRKREPEVWSVCFEQVVSSLVYKNYDPRSGKPPASSINRHGILHGSVVTYASELNSYRIIFLLNVMAKLAA